MFKWLETQYAGLTGHVEHLKGRSFDEVVWGNEKLFTYDDKDTRFGVQAQWHEAWMWFAYLYGDPAIINNVRERYDWTLNHPDQDGLLGPRMTKRPNPMSVFLRGAIPYYAETRDPRMLERITAHFLASKKRAGDRPWTLEYNSFWGIEILCWLYLQTGDRRMLDLALECADAQSVSELVGKLNRQPLLDHIRSYKNRMANAHGVKISQMIMVMVALYQATGDAKYLTAAENAYKVIDRSSMLVDGCPSARESLAGNTSVESHEACTINYSSGTFSYLLHTTGDAKWADRIERVCLNAGLGCVTKDFKQVQYFSSPNQVVAQNVTKIGGFTGLYLTFDSGRFDWCCAATVNRIIPSYIGTMWLQGPAGAVVAALYGPSTVTVKAGQEPVTIVEKTDFPFSGDIVFEVESEKPVRFPFWLRIPGWCEGAEIRINGVKQDIETKPATFAKLEREFRSGDKVSLRLPMKVKATAWPDGGIALERGPLVYSLRVEAEKHPMDPMVFSVDAMAAKRHSVATAPLGREFPQLGMTPKSAWNYALDVDPAKVADQVQVIQGRMTDAPWSDEGHAPVELKVPAHRVEGWNLITNSIKGRVELKPGQALTPDLPDPATMKLGAKETIALVPLGSTCLRLTVFPFARGAR
ncbi:MAG: glycoside hydrolase family 127 protein [bacterium]|nr:glycoside hydrolase family 127 protein [bacterium]